MTYVPGCGPCYRCIFEEIPADGQIDSCSQAGVLGTMPGIIGSLQALETQKYLLGTGDLLTGAMLVFDGLSMEFRKVKFSKASPSCRVCGEKADIKTLEKSEYEVAAACQWKGKQ